MKTKTFEEFLKERHAANYIGFDDDMPDAFEQWLTTLEYQDLRFLADAAIAEAYSAGFAALEVLSSLRKL